MAELLRIQPQVPRLDPGQIRVLAPGGALLGRGLSELGGTFEKIRDAADKAEAVRSTAEGRQEYEGILQETFDTINDPNEFREKGSIAIKEAHQRRLEAATTPNARALIEANLSAVLMDADNKLKHGQRTKLKGKAEGDYLAARDQIIKSIPDADDANRSGLNFMFGDLVGNMVKNNFMSREKAQTQLATFAVDSDKARAGRLLETDPERLKATITGKNFPHLTAEQRYTYDQHANEVIRERTKEVEKARKAQVDAFNSQMLVASESGTSLALLRQSVLDRLDKRQIPFEAGKQWVDRLNGMIKAAGKPGPDPYKVSDGATFARVMAGVFNEPEKWEAKQITDLAGRGLSNAHAYQLASLLKRSETEPAGTLTPLKMAQKTWEKLMAPDMLAFVPQEERVRNVPETLVKNNREAQRVWDEVVRREANREDPRVVLDELMQPHYEETVKGWLDFITKRNPEQERQERVQARQLLTKRGIAINEANIQEAIQHFRKKNSPFAAPETPTRQPKPATETDLLNRLNDLEKRNQDLTDKLIESKGGKSKPELRIEY